MTRFPRLIVVTDRHLSKRAGRSLLDTITSLLGVADFAVLYREKDLADIARRALGRAIADALPDGRLIVAGDPRLARELRAAAVHLAGDQPVASATPRMRVGRSCHTADEVLVHAEALDYATLSPVAASLSKPGHGPSVGDSDFQKACASGIPIWALGGISATNARRWLDLGAAAVATCGAVMAAPDPRTALADLERALP